MQPKNQEDPILDLSVIEELKKLGNDDGESLVEELATLFLDLGAKQTQDLKKALESGDLKQLKHGAHSLKSSAGNLGARRFSKLCQRIENLETLEGASHLVLELEDQWKQLRKELENEIKRAA